MRTVMFSRRFINALYRTKCSLRGPTITDRDYITFRTFFIHGLLSAANVSAMPYVTFQLLCYLLQRFTTE